MPNTTFKAEGHIFRKNTPTVRVFDGKDYFLTFEGTKVECEKSADPLKREGHFIRIIKTPKGYEKPKNFIHPKKKYPYGLYVRMSTWK